MSPISKTSAIILLICKICGKKKSALEKNSNTDFIFISNFTFQHSTKQITELPNQHLLIITKTFQHICVASPVFVHFYN